MSPADSITEWLGRLQAGEADAAQQLWERYFARLAGLARRKLRGKPRLPADEEEVALSAMRSFFRGAAGGRFPQLHDRDNLWALLVPITARKARHLIRRETAEKRGGGKVRGEDALRGTRDSEPEFGLDQVIGREPTPEFEAQMGEEFDRLLERLGDPQLQDVAKWRMEGYTVEEIAAKIGFTERSVKRKLRLIRNIWQNGGDQ
jgi:DNA-directed RNA polymerase specialized sigma24 family protein